MLMFKVAFLLISNINQSACSILDWVLKSQSGLIERFLDHKETPINKKTIPIYTCLIRNKYVTGYQIVLHHPSCEYFVLTADRV